MRWALRLAPALVGFWVLLSGHYTALLLTLGALSVGVVGWITARTRPEDAASLPLRSWLRLPAYLLWLGGEVLRASVSVSRLAWMPRQALRPAVGVTPAHDLSELSLVIYANSITLTPGTLSMRVVDEGIRVHSIQWFDLSQLQTGRMYHRVRRLEAR